MSCETYGNLTICRPDPAGSKIRVLYCPKCKQKRRVVQKFYESYASSFAVAKCPAPRRKWAHFEPCGYEWNWGE